ncbi:MAG: hypothetical protein HXX18_02635 [Bacteroidetes bacterium]|nr:hypothetical protein [Bacteroidota bacterium]
MNNNMQKHALKIICYIFCSIYINANSQNANISSFTIKTNYKTTFNAGFNDTIGKYGSNDFGISFIIPVYKHLFVNKENKSGFYNLSLLNSNNLIFSKIDFLDKNNTLLNLNLGIKGVYFSGNKNLWLSKITLNFFEDEYSISAPHPKFSGTFIFDRIVNRNFSYHLGLTYRYSFGIASFLPVAGLKYGITDRWKLLLSLPFYSCIQYKVNKQLQLSTKIRPTGTLSYYTNKSKLFGQSQEILLFRKRANTFSLDALYKLNSSISILGEVGREANRKIYFSNLRTEINKEPINYFMSRINSTWFINFGFAFKLGKTKSTANDYTIDYFEDDFDF